MLRIIDLDNGHLVLQVIDTNGDRYQHAYSDYYQLAEDIRAAEVNICSTTTWDNNEIDTEWETPCDNCPAYSLSELRELADERVGSAALQALLDELFPLLDRVRGKTLTAVKHVNFDAAYPVIGEDGKIEGVVFCGGAPTAEENELLADRFLCSIQQAYVPASLLIKEQL